MSSNLFASIVDSLSNGIYVLQDNRAVYLNQRFGEIFGYESLEPLLMCDMYETVYPDRLTVDFFRGVHDQMLANGQTKAAWGQASAKCDGTPIWLDVEAQTVMLNGRPAIMGMFHDFTECKLIGEAMFVSQETLRLLLDAMEDRVYVVTDDLKIVYANQKMMATLCGDINTELCHKVCRGLDSICVDCSAEEVFNSNKPMYKEFYNEITHKWYSVIELAIRMPGINRPAKLAVARDITDRKESEERIRALSHRLLNVHEDERKRLSRELHDDLGQRLNAVKIGVDTLAEDLENFPPEIYNHVSNLSKVLQSSIESVRSICSGLRPASLEMTGLVEAIKKDCANLTELHGLKIDLKSTGMKKINLDSDAEINLYRVFQESLNNIVKHAKASEVRISLIASHPIIRMRIEDNGKGFDILERKAKNDNRLGLVGIAERVDLMGGTFKMASRPGEGTRIVVEIPYSS
ncbi:MAG: PAS domain S-box protein [Geobacteraceae bacterium]|nr:PAS domain S-box protein [Geobacteraceae bacterium]NTW79647.1 PAS domain S-box protein [Geobacteraceae bacterium]